MRGAAVAFALTIAILVGAGAAYLFGNASVRTVTSVSTTNAPPVTATVTQTLPNLELLASIAPPVASPGQNITVVAEIYNPLIFPVTVQTTGLDNPAYGPCSQDFFTGINVYAGHYSSTNVSGANPLLLYGPAIYLCPPYFTLQYTFNPNSDIATRQTTQAGRTMNDTRAIIETSVVSGFWSGGSSSTFHKFPSGSYTVLIFDQWGQQTLDYFEVR